MRRRGFTVGLILAVAAERAFELALSRRNGARLRRRGAVEAGWLNTRVMVVFHGAVLIACALEGGRRRARVPRWLRASSLLALAGAQALRYWCVVTLGDRWNIRVLPVPGAPPITSGPYRFLRHPNYLAVIVEMAALPIAVGAWRTALWASLGNAVLLWNRIAAEERALGSAYRAALAERPRLWPARKPHVGRRAHDS